MAFRQLLADKKTFSRRGEGLLWPEYIPLHETDLFCINVVPNRCSCVFSRRRSRTCSVSTRSTTTPSAGPGSTSCSASWRSAAPPSPSAPQSPRTRSISTGSTCTLRTGAGSLRWVGKHFFRGGLEHPIFN